MPDPSPSLLLLAGAWAGEREPPAGARPEPGWHQPPHVRDPGDARRRLVKQVAAGADAITAPTFWTARPVLARYGEARRAREWTELAVRLARQAREEAGRQVLICGSLMEQSEEFEAQAGMIAEAGADVLLVEAMVTVASARAATLAAAATGLPVWSGARLDSREWLGEWAEAVEHAAAERLLAYGAIEIVLSDLEELGRLTSRALGACLTESASKDDVTRLLERGASVVGLASGATPAALRPLREAIDERLAAGRAAREDVGQAWWSWLERAVLFAPAGAALWLGTEPDRALPPGFAWTVAPPDDVARMPEEHFRLVVVGASTERELPIGQLGRLLDEGGVLLGPRGLTSEGRDGRLSLLDRSDDPPLAILRRQ